MQTSHSLPPSEDHMKASIMALLTKELSPSILQVENQSHLHQGHAGDNGSGMTHYHIYIEVDSFHSMGRLDRQRQVMDVLQPLFDKGLHALQLSCESPT